MTILHAEIQCHKNNTSLIQKQRVPEGGREVHMSTYSKC